MLIVAFLLGIQISEAKEVVYINHDYDVAFAEYFLRLHAKVYSTLNYQKIDRYPFSFTMNTTEEGGLIKGYEIGGTKFVFHFFMCQGSECSFRINGIPTGAFRASTDEIEYLFKLNDCYAMRLDKVIDDYCDGSFCDYELKLQDIVDTTIKRICPVICGDNQCELEEDPNSCPQDCPPVCGDNLCSKDENCKKDDCCEGEIVNLKKDVENCGKCGLECGKHENCVQGICIPICRDGYCVKGETCIFDNCCDGNKIDFDKDTNNCGLCRKQYGINEKCKNSKCVTYCGNSICEADEDCSSCPSDCGCKNGLECSNSQCVEPECTTNSDCDDNDACTLDICSGTPHKCSNKKIKDGCDVGRMCVDVGVQIGNLYCNKNQIVTFQTIENGTCSNDYECLTNYCLNKKCQDKNFFKRTFNWFKKRFWFW